MQDGVGLALLHFLQQMTRFECGLRDDLDTATFRLRQDFIHYWKRAMGAGSDNQTLATPGNFFPSRKRRVAELFTELFGRSFLPFPYFAAVDHYIVRVALPLDLDFAKFHQSRFHIAIFRRLDLRGNDAVDSRLRLCWQLKSEPQRTRSHANWTHRNSLTGHCAFATSAF